MSVALKQINAPGIDFRESPLLSHVKISQLMYSVLSNDLKFNDLEHKLFKVLQEQFCILLEEVLEKLDDHIMCSVKRQGWEVKDKHIRTIESSFGPISFSRRYYTKTTTNGFRIYAYLLDEALGLEKGKNLSPRLTEMAITLASENSYRTSSKFLEEILGVKISHEGIRQAVQEAGEHIAKWDNESTLDNSGKKEVPLLVVEVDGINVKQQIRNQPKKKRKDRKKFEMKVAVVYEGWEKENQKSKLKNPTHFVYLGEAKKFWKALERHLSRKYSLEGCDLVIVGGDGASWIQEGAESIGAEYQYCRFHMERDLRKLFKDQKDIKKAIKKVIKDNEPEKFNMILDALITDAEEGQKEKLRAYKSLMNNVWDGLKDYREREKPVPENARGLGVIEPNVGHTIARRFKRRCASWSHEGAINLAKVRCSVRNGNLLELLNQEAPRPIEENNVHQAIPITQGYWARRTADGLKKESQGDWCRATMPGGRSSNQAARHFASLMREISMEVFY